MTASRLVGPRPATEPPSRAPLVGRVGELARLAGAIADLRAGRGQVLLVVGDAGLGKTRTLTELLSLAGEDITRLEGRCVSYGAGSPYGPFVELLLTWLGTVENAAIRVDRAIALHADQKLRRGAIQAEPSGLSTELLRTWLGSRRRTPSSRSGPSSARAPARSWGPNRTGPCRTWA